MPEKTVQLRVGNTYRSIPHHEAPLDRQGIHRKTHEWTMYVEILALSDPDLVERVEFDLGRTFKPRTFTCRCPIPAKNGTAWRFTTKQTTYGFTTAKITIRGQGGSTYETKHKIQPHNYEESRIHTFVESRSLRPMEYLKFAESQKFGIELELSSPNPATHLAKVAQVLSQSQHASYGDVIVVDSYTGGRATMPQWKLVPDSSIVCSPAAPDCTKFELVSPVLKGGSGLSQVCAMLRALGEVQIKVNKSMGFHIHVDVEALSIPQLVNVCQNFIKYEQLMDSFMPLSRRTGSEESKRFFQSNRDSVGVHSSNKARHDRLAACQTVSQLADVMNVTGSKYYKLNLQNLKNGRQPTLEFRQHSATSDLSKVTAWIRFCSAFVLNSARLAAPSCFASANKPLDEQFTAMFAYVIKDRALRDFYRNRQKQVSTDEGEACAICRMTVSNGARPTLECTLCHKRFHNVCLTQWFQQSERRQCAQCHQDWQGARVDTDSDRTGSCCASCAAGRPCQAVAAASS